MFSESNITYITGRQTLLYHITVNDNVIVSLQGRHYCTRVGSQEILLVISYKYRKLGNLLAKQTSLQQCRFIKKAKVYLLGAYLCTKSRFLENRMPAKCFSKRPSKFNNLTKQPEQLRAPRKTLLGKHFCKQLSKFNCLTKQPEQLRAPRKTLPVKHFSKQLSKFNCLTKQTKQLRVAQ